MSLLGRFLGGKDDGKKKKKKKAGSRESKRKLAAGKRRTPSTRRSPTRPDTRKIPSSVKRPAAAPKPAESRVADAMAEIKPASAPASRSSRKKRVSLKGKQLGALLVKASAVNQDQVNEALNIQAEKGGLLGHILEDLGYCSKTDVGAALKKQRTITTVELPYLKYDPEALELLDRAFCERNRLIPFEKMGNQICVAMSNVLDTQAKNDIKEKTQLQVKVFDAAWPEIQEAINKHIPADEVEGAAPTEAPAEEEELVIELPEEEIDVIEDVAELPMQTAGQTQAQPQAPAPAPPITTTPAKPEKTDTKEPGAEKVIIEDKPKPVPASEMETVKEELPAPAAAADPEPIEEIPEIEDIEVIEDIAEVEAVESTGETPGKQPEPEAITPDRKEPEPAPEIQEIAEIEDIGIIEVEPIEEEAGTLPVTAEPVLPEPEAASAPAPATITPESDTIEEIEDIGIEVIEETATPEPAPEPEPPVEVQALPAGELKAIPMSSGYFSEVVQWGQADAERRWLAEHLADNALPLKPAPDLKAS